MHEDQPGGRRGDAHLAEERGHRDEHDLERDEAAEQHQAEQDIGTPELPLGEHITIQQPECGGDDHRSDGHLDRVPEVAFDAVAAQADAGALPGIDPWLYGPVFRQRDHVAFVDFGQVFERGEDHHHQWQQIDEREEAEQAVDDDARPGDARALRPLRSFPALFHDALYSRPVARECRTSEYRNDTMMAATVSSIMTALAAPMPS